MIISSNEYPVTITILDHLIPYWCIRLGIISLDRTMNYVGPGCLRIRMELHLPEAGEGKVRYRQAVLKMTDCERNDEVELPRGPNEYWSDPWRVFKTEHKRLIFQRGPWAKGAPLSQMRGLSQEEGESLVRALHNQEARGETHFPTVMAPTTVGVAGVQLVMEEVEPQRVVNLLLALMRSIAQWTDPHRGAIEVKTSADLDAIQIIGVGKPYGS